MSDRRLRFERVPLTGHQEYVVFDGGQMVGTVRKWERRYNLRRVYVTRGWRATMPNGHRLWSQDGVTARTRRDAALALALVFGGRAGEAERLVGRGPISGAHSGS